MAEYLASIFGTEKDKVNCSFYFKIGACRHGDRCSRIHNKPNFSQTCLLQNLYVNPQNSAKSADGSHLVANVSDEEMQEHYDNFFEDVFVECEDKYGEIEEMNVCDNLGDHLVGNVYIKFRREDDAKSAVNDLNNRWFGGRPVYAELSPVTDFREACCRQYEMGECTRSGFCNFMHLKPISRELRRTPMENSKRTLKMPKNQISHFPKLENVKLTQNVELKEFACLNKDLYSCSRTEDCAKLFPCYASVLVRQSQGGILLDDLDILQHELETLYSKAARRNRILKSQADDRIRCVVSDKKRKSFEKPSSALLKRMKLDDKLNTRSNYLNPFDNILSMSDTVIRQPRIFKPRNDLSVKFWTSVESYCQDINRNHVNYLDELLKRCSNKQHLYIPDIGKSHSSEWLLLTEMQRESKTQLNSLILKDISSPKMSNNWDETRHGLCFEHYLRNGLISDCSNGITLKPCSGKDEILEEIEKCYKELNALNKNNVGNLNKLRNACVENLKQKTLRTLLHRVNSKVTAIRVRNVDLNRKEC